VGLAGARATDENDIALVGQEPSVVEGADLILVKTGAQRANMELREKMVWLLTRRRNDYQAA